LQKKSESNNQLFWVFEKIKIKESLGFMNEPKKEPLALWVVI
jgi:hypothetical protein